MFMIPVGKGRIISNMAFENVCLVLLLVLTLRVTNCFETKGTYVYMTSGNISLVSQVPFVCDENPLINGLRICTIKFMLSLYADIRLHKGRFLGNTSLFQTQRETGDRGNRAFVRAIEIWSITRTSVEGKTFVSLLDT